MTLPTFVADADFAVGSDDIAPYGLDGFTVTRGTSALVTTGFVAEAGTFSTSLNNIDRRFDPNFETGPYVTAGETDLVPGVPIALSSDWNAPLPMFTGRADGWPQDYPLFGADQRVNFQATDAIGFFAGAQLAIQRPAEYSGARIQAIVDELLWPGPVSIGHGNCIVGPLNFSTISAWSHMTDCAMAEWGELYVAADGTLTFRSRDQILSETRSTVIQATYIDNSLGPSGLQYSGRQMVSPDIVNDCTITHNDRGNQVNYQDATSIAAPWGLRSLNKSLPIHTETQAQQYARWIVLRYKSPLTTFKSVTFTPSNEPGATDDLWEEVFTRELGDLVTVIGDPLVQNPTTHVIAPSGAPIERDCWIRGIEHNFQAQPWSVTLHLQDASWRANLFRWDVSEWDDPDAVWGL